MISQLLLSYAAAFMFTFPMVGLLYAIFLPLASEDTV